MTGIAPTPENFRLEMARHRLRREDVAQVIGMNLNMLSMFVNETRRVPYWASHNIGYAINKVTGIRIFEVEMLEGIKTPVRSTEGRKPVPPAVVFGVRLPTKPRKRRYRKASVEN